MIYLVYGNLREKVISRSNDIVARQLGSIADGLFIKVDNEAFEKTKIEELIGVKSLFTKKVVILCDGLCSTKENSAFILKKIKDIAASDNIFVFREAEVDKKVLDSFIACEASIEELNDRVSTSRGYVGAHEVKIKAGYEGFNIFSFTDAIGRRDKKTAWVLYHKALRAGFPAEELFWKAVWIFRNIMLASPINRDPKGVVSALRISPFVFNKAKGFVGGYDLNQLVVKYKDLVSIYHQTRRGLVDIEMATEQFILNL